MICFKCGKLVFEEECVTHCNVCHIEDMRELQDVEDATELQKRLNLAEIALFLFVGKEFAGFEAKWDGTFCCEECGEAWDYSIKRSTLRLEKAWHTARCKIAVGKQFLGLPVNIREE